MKNSKDYSKRIQKLHRTLARKNAKVETTGEENVTDTIVYAIVSSELNEKPATAAFKRLVDHFVDWNDLRVSRSEEILDILHKDTRATREIASTLVKVLNGIFDQYHTVSLESLKKTGKRPARQALEKIDGISRFAVDYCMLTSLKGHAVPLTKKMIEYLKANNLVDSDADEQQIGGFLAKQIPARNGYEFYTLLRHESEEGGGAKTKKKAKKKTKKKVKTAAKTKKKVKKKTKKSTRRKKA